MIYTLKFGKKFDRDFSKIDKSISNQIVKKLGRIKYHPENVGKPLLHTKPTLWEFKAESYRVFFIIQEKIKEIWLLSIKHKDECDDYIKKSLCVPRLKSRGLFGTFGCPRIHPRPLGRGFLQNPWHKKRIC